MEESLPWRTATANGTAITVTLPEAECTTVATVVALAAVIKGAEYPTVIAE
jgi:hypothetical protein